MLLKKCLEIKKVGILTIRLIMMRIIVTLCSALSYRRRHKKISLRSSLFMDQIRRVFVNQRLNNKNRYKKYLLIYDMYKWDVKNKKKGRYIKNSLNSN